jgi:cytochrome c-type biogenesis protein CcmH/NrfF
MANLGQEWARVIRDNSRPDGIRHAIQGINRETLLRRANHADVILACAQILGQTIAGSGPDIAAEMRSGIMSMIDGYAMEVAAYGE